MPLRQRLENLPVGQKLLAALLGARPYGADVAVCVPFPYLTETAATLAGTTQAVEPPALLARSAKTIPAPPWPAGDQKGMGNALGAGTWARCA